MEAEGLMAYGEGAEVKIAEGKQFNKGRAWREASLESVGIYEERAEELQERPQRRPQAPLLVPAEHVGESSRGTLQSLSPLLPVLLPPVANCAAVGRGT